MTKAEYFALAEKEMQGILDLIKRKGNDYSGGSEDVLENFKLAEKLGLAKAEVGLLLRMMDKVQRVRSFLSKGTLDVQNESAQDAVRDIIGYSLALLGLMEEKKTPVVEVASPNTLQAISEDFVVKTGPAGATATLLPNGNWHVENGLEVKNVLGMNIVEQDPRSPDAILAHAEGLKRWFGVK